MDIIPKESYITLEDHISWWNQHDNRFDDVPKDKTMCQSFERSIRRPDDISKTLMIRQMSYL